MAEDKGQAEVKLAVDAMINGACALQQHWLYRHGGGQAMTVLRCRAAGSLITL